MKTFIIVLLVAFSLVVLTVAGQSPNTDFIEDVAVVDGDQLFVYTNDGEILIELEDENNIYYFNYKGEEYCLYYVQVCSAPIGDVQECQSYVLFNERNYHAEHRD